MVTETQWVERVGMPPSSLEITLGALNDCSVSAMPNTVAVRRAEDS